MRKPRVLVIDDEEGIRKRLRKLLILEGYVVYIAESGPQGLKILRGIKDKGRAPIEIATLDIRMPGMEGTEVLEKIKQETPQAEVIMITGHGAVESAIQSLRAGAFDYITKPIEYDELALSISRALEKQLNITERKQAEELLGKTYQELKDTHVQLLQAGKMAAIGEMASGIAHELTQPLLGIKGFAAAMLEELKTFQPTETPTFPEIQAMHERPIKDIEVILQQTDRMVAIVNNVRQFARASGVEMSLLDINQPIEGALMLFSEQLRVHNITVKKSLAQGLPEVKGNANQLQQVFINLIVNARDAMDAKGDEGQLIVSTGVDTGCVYAQVEDNGIGADAETISKMFESFFTTKTKGESIGLGLSIVDRIIREHGGTINVQGKPGRGCKFTMHLPLAAEEKGDENE